MAHTFHTSIVVFGRLGDPVVHTYGAFGETFRRVQSLARLRIRPTSVCKAGRQVSRWAGRQVSGYGGLHRLQIDGTSKGRVDTRRGRECGRWRAGNEIALNRFMGQPHENLVAWQRADDLCVAIYKLTRDTFPRDERYQLVAQLRRAAYSVAANIVEGYAYPESPARARFLRIAIGSLAEVSYGLHLACRIGYLPVRDREKLDQQMRMAAAPLQGLLKRSERLAKSAKAR
jgi:four helix bundle protein